MLPAVLLHVVLSLWLFDRCLTRALSYPSTVPIQFDSNLFADGYGAFGVVYVLQFFPLNIVYLDVINIARIEGLATSLRKKDYTVCLMMRSLSLNDKNTLLVS